MIVDLRYSDEILIVLDQKASGTDGGTFTSGAWRTRDLNTVAFNSIAGASLSANQITLPAGRYLIQAIAPAFYVARHVAKLRNITDSTDALIGGGAHAGTDTVGTDSKSFILDEISILSTKIFEVQHYAELTRATTGFGTHGGGSVASIFTQVYIRKLK